VLALFCVEAGLRLGNPPQESSYDFDALLGWRNKAEYRGRLRSPEFDTAVQTNDRRMRESQAVSESSAKFRIAVLGDSFVWGHGVEESARFTEGLQERLGPDVEVLNFGVGGYGTDQERLQLERDVMPLSPDVVLVVFFVNDLADVMRPKSHVGVPKPRFVVEGEGLRLVGTPLPRIAGWDRPPRGRRFGSELKDRLRRAGDRVAQVLGLRPAEWLNPEHLQLTLRRVGRPPAPPESAAMAIHERLCVAMARLAKAGGSTFVLTEVPFKEYFASAADLHAASGDGQSVRDLDRPRRHMQRVAELLGVPYLDPYPDFAAAGGLDDYYAIDQHLNPKGHATMAAFLARELVARRIVPPR